MKRILFAIVLWSLGAGAMLWAPTQAQAQREELAPAHAFLQTIVGAKALSPGDEEPATWMLVLAGAVVLCFVAARRVD